MLALRTLPCMVTLGLDLTLTTSPWLSWATTRPVVVWYSLFSWLSEMTLPVKIISQCLNISVSQYISISISQYLDISVSQFFSISVSQYLSFSVSQYLSISVSPISQYLELSRRKSFCGQFIL